jgi:hypothetical protein
MGAYEPTAWQAFFSAAAGAAATLSGLIFVGISINARTIFAEERRSGVAYLTGRALESIVDLLVVLAISFIGLAPTISSLVFGAFLLFSALICAVSPFRFVRSFITTHVKPVAFNLRLFLTSVLVASLLVAGITELVGTGGGIDWLPFSFIVALTVASTNAWVLTVEVLR